MKNNWYEVDKDGWFKLIEQKSRGRILSELIQNAWDEEGVTKVTLDITPIPNKPLSTLIVTDDSDDGFHDLSHAYTLFAESKKKDDPTKRGRFNVGEKLVLNFCRNASIVSTTGTVIFSETGNRRRLPKKQEKGTTITAELRFTREQTDEAISYLQTLIPPENITTIINGNILISRSPIKTVIEQLPTEIADKKGNLKNTRRKTPIDFYALVGNEIPTLYEMGIPVVELDVGARWHVNINQKIPLNQDRDNVTPAYRKEVMAILANNMHDFLNESDFANPLWLGAVENERVHDHVYQKSLESRYGTKVVAFDPSDQEANSKAVAEGYVLIYGRQLSKEGWERAKKLKLIPSAGKLFPTHPAITGIAEPFALSDWTDAMFFIEKECIRLAGKLIDKSIIFTVSNMTDCVACYDRINKQLSFSVKRLGNKWFDNCMTEIKKDSVSIAFHSLLIHELAHEYESNHLSENYYNACCDLGAKLALIKKEENNFE